MPMRLIREIYETAHHRTTESTKSKRTKRNYRTIQLSAIVNSSQILHDTSLLCTACKIILEVSFESRVVFNLTLLWQRNDFQCFSSSRPGVPRSTRVGEWTRLHMYLRCAIYTVCPRSTETLRTIPMQHPTWLSNFILPLSFLSALTSDKGFRPNELIESHRVYMYADGVSILAKGDEYSETWVVKKARGRAYTLGNYTYVSYFVCESVAVSTGLFFYFRRPEIN